MKTRSPGKTTSHHKRFKIYFIDSGWDSPAHRAFENARSLLARYLMRHDLVILSHEQSEKFIQNHAHLIGADPLIAVLDPAAIQEEKRHDKGILFLLGYLKTEERTRMMLQMFLRLVNTRKISARLPEIIRRLIYKEGAGGTLEVILDTLAHVNTENDIPTEISQDIEEEG